MRRWGNSWGESEVFGSRGKSSTKRGVGAFLGKSKSKGRRRIVL